MIDKFLISINPDLLEKDSNSAMNLLSCNEIWCDIDKNRIYFAYGNDNHQWVFKNKDDMQNIFNQLITDFAIKTYYKVQT